MAKPIEILDECASEIASAYSSYGEISESLGLKFLDSIERAFENLIANPGIGAPAHRGSRRIVLTRFPYILYYREFNESTKLIACVHAKQDPDSAKKILASRS